MSLPPPAHTPTWLPAAFVRAVAQRTEEQIEASPGSRVALWMRALNLIVFPFSGFSYL